MRVCWNMRLLLVALLYVCRVAADVFITQPKGGSTFTASGGSVAIELEWFDDDAVPPLSEITEYRFVLCTGTNTDFISVGKTSAVKPSEVKENKYTASFPNTAGPEGSYFVQIYAAYRAGYTLHYSGRFTLKGMDGVLTVTFPPVNYITGPDGGTSITTGAAGAVIDTRSFTVPYTKQTGISRFAPMQQQPGDSVTATEWTRKYETSAVTYFSKLQSSMEQLTTITPGWSYTRPSDYNYATPAPFPTNNGGWYNPEERQTFSTRKLNLKRAL